MTDLEKHVNQPGRDKLVKKVREKIKELGITYIYFQFISVFCHSLYQIKKCKYKNPY